MALAFDPNRTFFKGINKYKQIHTSIYRKREGKGIKRRIQKEAGKLQPIKVSISETIRGYMPCMYEPIRVKW